MRNDTGGKFAAVIKLAAAPVLLRHSGALQTAAGCRAPLRGGARPEYASVRGSFMVKGSPALLAFAIRLEAIGIKMIVLAEIFLAVPHPDTDTGSLGGRLFFK